MQVAVYCDISEKTYQNYELMAREPKLEILAKIADLYEVSIDYLVAEKTKRIKQQKRDRLIRKSRFSFFKNELFRPNGPLCRYRLSTRQPILRWS